MLVQQGRVQVDADWNEQVSILLHHLRALAADVVGPHGGPGDAFQVAEGTNDFSVRGGDYFVNGVLCQNEGVRPGDGVSYAAQPDYPDPEALQAGRRYLAFLDAWERHLTYVQDERIREVALGGPDTATRARVVWQVRVKETTIAADDAEEYDKFLEELGELTRPGTGTLEARAREPERGSADPCLAFPTAHYRGLENQLYRVEIHDGVDSGRATFKWSRENGSVVFPVRAVRGNTVALARLGKDRRLGLDVGDWVELVDDPYELRQRAEALLHVQDVDRDRLEVTLDPAPSGSAGRDPAAHPLLRRWDSRGAIPVSVPGARQGWIPLENSIEIRFKANGLYRTGDYWLIPARIATGDIEWPRSNGTPLALQPHGVKHRYAPLAILRVQTNGAVGVERDLRRVFAGIGTRV